jgi:hypothetical protein
MNENELNLGKEYQAYIIDKDGNEIGLDSNFHIDIARGNDTAIELSLKKTNDGSFKIYKMKEINLNNNSDSYNKYLKRIKNRNDLYNKLKKLGRRL